MVAGEIKQDSTERIQPSQQITKYQKKEQEREDIKRQWTGENDRPFGEEGPRS